MIALLRVLEFRSSNTTHRPVIEALGVIARHAHAGNTTYYPLGEAVPTHRGVSGDWEDVVYRLDTCGRRRVVRMAYEVASFQAVRDALRCKEIWVVGADRWRNPDADLPPDFEQRRVEHYRELRKPLDPGEFIAGLRGELDGELSTLNEAPSELSWLSITDRRSGRRNLSTCMRQRFVRFTGSSWLDPPPRGVRVG